VIKISFLVLLIFLITNYALSQPLRFERITTKEGLSQNSVTSICQDSTGFMWFGTYSGLNRYDGYNYKIFKNEINNSQSLGNDFVRALCIDNSGVLWVGTMGGGLNRYNSEKECFTRFVNDPDDSSSLSHNSISALLLDRNGNLWIGTFGAGINKITLSKDSKDKNRSRNQTEEKLNFIHKNHEDIDVKNTFWNFINCFHEDKYGLIWIGTRHGLTKYDPEKDKFTTYIHQSTNNSSLSSSNINGIGEDQSGNLWVGTWDNGLNIYDREKDSFFRYSYKKNRIKFPGNESISYLYKDKSNEFWLGTSGDGLGKLHLSDLSDNERINERTSYFEFYQNNPYDMNSIGSNNIYAIFEDRSGVLWIGTDWGGLSKFDKKKSDIICYSSNPANPEGLNQNVMMTICKDQNDVLWLGTRDGGINLFDIHTKEFSYLKNNPDDPTSLMNNTVLTIYEGKDHTIWIGTATGLNKYIASQNEFIPYIIQPNDPGSTYIFAICEDKYGYLWLGTYASGLYRFDKRTGQTINYKFNASDSNSIGDNTVWVVHEDRYGDLWCGTNNGGLNRYDRKNNRFIRYTSTKDPNSITDNKVLVIFEDKSGGMWLGTTMGLNKLIRGNDKNREYSFIHFTKEDNGLASNTIHGILEDDHGNLWISSNAGISRFNPVTKEVKNFGISDGLQEYEFNVNSCVKDETTGEMYFGGINGFNIFHPDSIKENSTLPNVVITDLKIYNKSVPIDKEINGKIILNRSIINSKEIILDYKDNVFSIEFAALHFSSPEKNLYSYKLEGFEKEWNFVDAKHRTVTYTNLDKGTYTFLVKASNNDGKWNTQGASLKIIVTPPFWGSWWFRSLIILVIILSFIIFYKKRTQRIIRINRELEKYVAKRTEELELTNRELEAFTYSVSHDLRAPLRSVSSFSGILIEDYKGKIDKKGKEYLHRISTAVKQMNSLIDDMLKLSRVTRGKLVLTEVDLSSIIESIIEDLKQKEPDRKVEMNIKNSLIVNGDRALLTIMLQNLLDNAWKFTSKKYKTIIEFGKTSRNNKPVFYVKDNGIGFDNKFAKEIFEVFKRLHANYEGTGIGLATVQRIIKRHNGKIWAQGKTNEGATFYFTLNSK
jgi:ligand-binding sensor domain-containing protein/signal transduction histidine kinase